MEPILDPRGGDLEDDASSTKSKSLLALAGTLLSEISLPRLAWSVVSLLLVPALLLGAVPVVASAWVGALMVKATQGWAGLGSAALFVLVGIIGWFGWRPLFRVAENSFWSLHSLVVQPVYTGFREVLRHLAERALPAEVPAARRGALRVIVSLVSGVIVSGIAGVVILALWPSTHLFTGFPSLGAVWDTLHTILANGVVLIGFYLAIVALLWAIADATMAQPADFANFAARPAEGKTWRVAHLSDIHLVGENYGFRIESGRAGPQGNGQWQHVLARLAEIHAENEIDIVLITGDVTDAGRSAEWVTFEEALADYPVLAARMLVLPGNHDVNIVDRANPARLDLPASPNRRLRLIRTISALAGLQGERVRIVDVTRRGPGDTLAAVLAPHVAQMRRFAATGMPRFSNAVPDLWERIFPMVLPPAGANGLGVILLNSNAASHFSFTNALGLVSAEQARRVEVALRHYPGAVWIIALHHHLLEYPREVKNLSERIGTALINGNWFVRKLQPYAGRVVVMHGHRHIDWIGACADLPIISAPSPVMEPGQGFYIHTLAHAGDGKLHLLAPERVAV